MRDLRKREGHRVVTFGELHSRGPAARFKGRPAGTHGMGVAIAVPDYPSHIMNIPQFPPYGQKESGAIGYIILWLLGVPATVLFIIFLLRGCT